MDVRYKIPGGAENIPGIFFYGARLKLDIVYTNVKIFPRFQYLCCKINIALLSCYFRNKAVFSPTQQVRKCKIIDIFFLRIRHPKYGRLKLCCSSSWLDSTL